MTRASCGVACGLLWLLSSSGAAPLAQSAAPSFASHVRPVLADTCQGCHNSKVLSGGLDVAPLLEPSSIASQPLLWERIVGKLQSGEMPPPGVARPAAEKLDAVVTVVEQEFDRLDRATKPDPGRVTARRLNRQEYANTVRDLLGVTIRPEDEFPADDSGYGFDNIADVLTVSPALMQKYLAVAERVASRAVGGDPLPKAGFFTRRERVRRLSPSGLELQEILEYDADYVVRVTVSGYRPQQDTPVTLRISVDGRPVKTASIPVGISAVNRQGGATQRTVEEVRLFLPANGHTFLAELVGDEGLKKIQEGDRLNVSRNIFPETIEIAGPYPAATPQPITKTVLSCDPATGPSCVTRILSTLSRRAYRRPVTKQEVADLVAIADKARSSGYTPAQSLQFGITAMLVSPNFLFRIERDPKPGTSAPVSELELASRLSYFLWSSMPDEELLRLAEAGRLRSRGTLEAQLSRMIADP